MIRGRPDECRDLRLKWLVSRAYQLAGLESNATAQHKAAATRMNGYWVSAGRLAYAECDAVRA